MFVCLIVFVLMLVGGEVGGEGGGGCLLGVDGVEVVVVFGVVVVGEDDGIDFVVYIFLVV